MKLTQFKVLSVSIHFNGRSNLYKITILKIMYATLTWKNNTSCTGIDIILYSLKHRESLTTLQVNCLLDISNVSIRQVKLAYLYVLLLDNIITFQKYKYSLSISNWISKIRFTSLWNYSWICRSCILKLFCVSGTNCNIVDKIGYCYYIINTIVSITIKFDAYGQAINIRTIVFMYKK